MTMGPSAHRLRRHGRKCTICRSVCAEGGDTARGYPCPSVSSVIQFTNSFECLDRQATERHMGCRVSCDGTGSTATAKVNNAVLLDELNFTGSEIRKLNTYFNKYDNFDTGKLLIYNFVTSSRIDFSVFFRKVLGLFDVDRSGKLSFSEFACSLWSFLTLSPDIINSYVYELYDEMKSGRVNITELKHMLRDLHRSNYDRSGKVISAVGTLDYKKKRELSRSEFLQWTSSNPFLLAPAVQLQEKMRQTIVSEKFWVRLQARRKSLSPVEESCSETHNRLRAMLCMSNFHDKVCSQLILSERGSMSAATSGGDDVDSQLPVLSSPLPFPAPPVNDVIPKVPGGSPAGEERQRGDDSCPITDYLEDFPCQQDGFLKMKPAAKRSYSTEESRSLASMFSSSAASVVISRQGSRVYSVVDINIDESTSQGNADEDLQTSDCNVTGSPSLDFLEAVRKKLEGIEWDDPRGGIIQPQRTCVSPENEREDNLSDISEDSAKGVKMSPKTLRAVGAGRGSA